MIESILNAIAGVLVIAGSIAAINPESPIAGPFVDASQVFLPIADAFINLSS